MLLSSYRNKYLDAHGEELVRASAAGFVARVVSAAGVFAFSVLLTRTLGVADSGLFFLAVGVVSAISVVSRAGLDNAIVRFSAAAIAGNQWSVVGHLYRRSTALVSALSTAFAIAIYIGAPWIAAGLFTKPGLAEPLRVLAVCLLPISLIMLHCQFLQSQKRIAPALYFQSALIPTISIITIALLPVTWSLGNITMVYTGAGVLGVILVAGVWLGRAGFFGLPRNSYDSGEFFASSLTLIPSDLVNKILQPWAALICLGLWSTETDAGLFMAASRIAALITFALIPVNSFAAPKIAALWHKGHLIALRKITQQATLLMIAVAAPMLLAIVLVPELIMSVFGDDFRSAAAILLVLAAAQIINVVTGPVRSLLLMTGNEQDHRSASLAGGITILVGCFVLVPAYGGLGAAWSAAASLIVTNIGATIFVWRRLGFLPIGLFQRDTESVT
ncbi:MAG: polysaccharide biosynthesis C-terminal domain-containing protein [Gammaproteobacteria bacterium]|jgi:O-antigen/teichoic acid export membrane protein|nr:polysaccharide biosynthesis C-terminal domain-containing protein [Gammaproteobacteria bacterium]MDP6653469.1 polysaccharide biosynthesis C-terminal domain-containing protein [Gammaproteobacteria bacterium]